MLHLRFLSFCGVALVAAASAGLSGNVVAADWGTLKGRFVVDGTVPTPAPINVNKDQEVCSKHNLVDESVVVGKDGGLENVVIYLRDKKPQVNPEYEKTAKDKVEVDNKNCRFEPHVTVLRTGQTLDLKNSDPIGHNSKLDALINPPANVLIPSGQAVPVTSFTQDEGLPVKIGCNIHPWMGGWIVVRSNPYAAASKADGSFEIKDLPAGKELEFQFWQEKVGYLKDIQGKGLKADTKGRAKIMIKPGTNDLGDIKVSAKLLSK